MSNTSRFWSSVGERRRVCYLVVEWSYKSDQRCVTTVVLAQWLALILAFPIAHWINEDGSKPTTFIGLEITDNIILLTGNITLYNAAFPSAPLVPVVSLSLQVLLSFCL